MSNNRAVVMVVMMILVTFILGSFWNRSGCASGVKVSPQPQRRNAKKLIQNQHSLPSHHFPLIHFTPAMAPAESFRIPDPWTAAASATGAADRRQLVVLPNGIGQPPLIPAKHRMMPFWLVNLLAIIIIPLFTILLMIPLGLKSIFYLLQIAEIIGLFHQPFLAVRNDQDPRLMLQLLQSMLQNNNHTIPRR